jgi:hypothetical protein
MSALSFTLDRSVDILIDARIRVVVPPADLQVRLTTRCGGITTTHTGATKMAYTLPSDKMVELSIAYVDANGNAASVDGAVAWDSSDEGIAAIEPVAPDGSTVMLVPGTKIGNCQVSAKADADLGAGVRELITLLDVTVVGGEAVAGVITPSGSQVPKG